MITVWIKRVLQITQQNLDTSTSAYNLQHKIWHSHCAVGAGWECAHDVRVRYAARRCPRHACDNGVDTSPWAVGRHTRRGKWGPAPGTRGERPVLYDAAVDGEVHRTGMREIYVGPVLSMHGEGDGALAPGMRHAWGRGRCFPSRLSIDSEESGVHVHHTGTCEMCMSDLC